MEDKKNKIGAIIVALVVGVLFVVGLVFATKYDLDISKKIADLKPGVYQSQNVFGRIFETIGEMPLYIVSLFASSVIVSYFYRSGRVMRNVIIVIIFEVISIFVAYYAFYKLFKYLNAHYEFASKLDWTAHLAYFVLGLIVVMGMNFLSKKYSDDFVNSTIVPAFVTVATVITATFLTQVVLKIPAGRYRYCTMNALNDFSYFTRWYEFNGKISPTAEMLAQGIAKDGMKSFPSGHSNAAAMLIVFTMLPYFYSKANNFVYKVVSWSGFSLYTLSVMFSRILMGKHFLSDVLVGVAITVICFYVCLFFLKRFFENKVRLEPLKKKRFAICEERAD